jgi:hypothetical protein
MTNQTEVLHPHSEEISERPSQSDIETLLLDSQVVHNLESIHTGRLTDCVLSVDTNNTNANIELTNNNTAIVTNPEDISSEELATTDPQHQTHFSDFSPKEIENGVSVDVPLENNSHTHITIQPEFTAYIELEIDSISQALYYKIPLDSYTLSEVQDHAYLQTNTTESTTFQRRKILAEFDNETQATLYNAPSSLFQTLRHKWRQSTLLTGPNISFVTESIGAVLTLSVMAIWSLFLLGQGSLVGVETVYDFSGTYPQLFGVGFLLLVVGLILQDFYQSYEPADPHQQVTLITSKQLPKTTVNTQNISQSTQYPKREVKLSEKEDQIHIQDVENNTSWTAPKENGILTEESLEFITEVGFDTVDSNKTVTVYQSKNGFPQDSYHSIQLQQTTYLGIPK